ncbi:hypothetical protein [Rahnella inusitata]|uniref:hypothetical protein n=1 Tax=Rahnella inusitata TaxID=58169 RepID=UPI001BC8698B|nr:hypothetical protein [Rahnella inusitata]QUT17086.1 hypothetical protein I2123_10015 [Rahnella inusitata]
MVTKPLSNELISLVNYVELNKSGWWKKATSQIIVGFLWECESDITAIDLHAKITSDLNISIPIENITSQLDYLLSKEKILKNNLSYRLTENERKSLKIRNIASFDENAKVETLFKALLIKEKITQDTSIVWEDFRTELIKSIQKIGANTYTFLKNGTLYNNHDWLNGFLNKYPSELHISLKKVLTEFFNPNVEYTKNYILRSLNAYFFVEATQLKKETIKILENTKKQRNVKIILDTNFVFSVLGLHENPADESAASLLSLSEKVGSVKISYYILPTTLEEIKKVVAYQLDNLKRVRYSPHLARAAIKSGIKSSIAAKYFTECSKTNDILSPEAYFLPYTDGLVRHLEHKGIKILEWPTVHYPSDERIISDQVTLWKKEEKRPESQRKRYEAIEHDLIFWYIIKDHREETAESPLDENYWGVTIDFSMIHFDQLKRKIRQTNLPVVLHPTNLVQLLQFWVPRDDALESGILETMRLPLLFGEFDAKDEKVTIEIIQALTTFKNINDIDIDILSSMLADKALKQKIIDSDSSNDEIISFLESEFAKQATHYKTLFESKKSQIEEVNSKLENLASENNSFLIDSESKITAKDEQIALLEQKITQIEESNLRILEQKRNRKDKFLFITYFALIPLSILICIFIFAFPWLVNKFHLEFIGKLITAGMICYATLLILSFFSELTLSKKPKLNEWVLIKAFKNTTSKVLVPLVIAIFTMKDEILEMISKIQ